ncbi:MAG TPA: hypothetical protein VHN99_08115 [Deinococcales bacterium]|nr:hypothetical protein [Deinococcales bacterium]
MRWFWVYIVGVVIVIGGLLLVLNGSGALSRIPPAVLWGGIILVLGIGVLGAVGRTKPDQKDIDVDGH